MRSSVSGHDELECVRADIESVVLTERWARDLGRWDVMEQQFHPDSVVDISWVKSSGPEFVDLSRQAHGAGGHNAHLLGPGLIEVSGHRATADTAALIAGRVVIRGVLATMTAHSRIVERLEKRDGRWRISQLTCVYQFDQLVPVYGKSLPIDRARLARYRTSYSALSYWVEETRGVEAVRNDLPGVDLPATVDAVYDANAAWLADGHTSTPSV